MVPYNHANAGCGASDLCLAAEVRSGGNLVNKRPSVHHQRICFANTSLTQNEMTMCMQHHTLMIRLLDHGDAIC
jgi:hypothetical protein